MTGYLDFIDIINEIGLCQGKLGLYISLRGHSPSVRVRHLEEDLRDSGRPEIFWKAHRFRGTENVIYAYGMF